MSKIKIPRGKNYLDRADLGEMRKRQDMINHHLTVAEALAIVKNTWIAQKGKKYGLDPAKVYNVDAQTGQITEAPKQEDGQNKH